MSPLEQSITGMVTQDALAAGYTIGVWDGEDTQYRGIDPAEIMLATAVTDETIYYFYEAGSKRPFGYVLFIHGNEEDVISNCSTDPRVGAILERAMNYVQS